jgi:hypothetical protein
MAGVVRGDGDLKVAASSALNLASLASNASFNLRVTSSQSPDIVNLANATSPSLPEGIIADNR